MPTVRVFVPTCGRPHLLRRALQSLLGQTFSDWVAEVHNDLPDDEGPARLITQLQDSRIALVQHAQNIGGTATFNKFFSSSPEPYYSILEDDNWWEPTFLERMIEHLTSTQGVVVAWSNQRVAEERDDGSWVSTEKTVRPTDSLEPQLVTWPQIDQLYGAVHSQGAMLIRSRPEDDFRTPDVEMTAMEGFRERCFPHPLLFVPEPLAWFSVTRQTYRKRTRARWVATQALFAASLLLACPATQLNPEAVWSKARVAAPPTTSLLILIALAHKKLRSQLRYADMKDWARFIGSTLKRPHVSWAALTAHRRDAALWQFLYEVSRRQLDRGARSAPVS